VNETNARDAASEGRPSVVKRLPSRGRQTRRSVIVADRIANWTITVGGLGVIAAVIGIMVFLANVVWPLFAGTTVKPEQRAKLERPAGEILKLSVDEYRTTLVSMTREGIVGFHDRASGKLVTSHAIELGGRKITAFVATADASRFALGLDDGTLRLGELKLETSILNASDVPDGLTPLSGPRLTNGKEIFEPVESEHTGTHQVRRTGLSVSVGEPEQVAESGVALVAVDYRLGGTVERPTRAFGTVDAKGIVRISRVGVRRNLLTGKETLNVESIELPPLPAGTSVKALLMTSEADQLFVAERSGFLTRYDVRSDTPVIAERARVVAEGAELSALAFLLGEQSLVVGGSDGSVTVFNRLPRSNVPTSDGFALVPIHVMERQGAAITHIEGGQRSKTFATVDANGSVWVRHATTNQTLFRLPPATGGTERLVLAPREDAVLALAKDDTLRTVEYYAPHPETTFASIFGKVWYEGYPEPTFTWQSSSGTDSFEPKLSLVPLIFGTIKAAVYSLLFAVPVALLAAIYTSEFVGPRIRGTVKPVMEMMASLPSVVLGFIAALILAPLVESAIAAVILALILLPLSVFTGAHLWQLVPYRLAIRVGGPGKLVLTGLALVVGLVATALLAPAFERLFFAGDFRAWVNRDIGQSLPFMTLLLWPLAFAILMLIDVRGFLSFLPWSYESNDGLSALLRWISLLIMALLLALGLAVVLSTVGFDIRGGVLDTYVQRNTLVVGFAMGFAVIPIIYTIAEDALTSVPEHLRAASLACGATPWQTAVRVILPTALSGIFAAVMIGLGRAVGETMIVVMAAGNTPVIDWNIFNGFRALSANIAVELPEAVKDGTLYRMLFLAALTLFAMTFVLNTCAEIVRLRFRKRAAQL